MLGALGAALNATLTDAQALTDFLKLKKSYAPTHETSAVAITADPSCRTRTAQLFNALCDILLDPCNASSPLFEHVTADSTAAMQVFRFLPP
jgi:hypothetical protein